MARDSELETDYLVVGAGALGMAFVDSLIEHSDADVVMVDRRHRPGGHWLDSYPFVQLHQPSRFYGVHSTPLGQDRTERDGMDAGFYERAAARKSVATSMRSCVTGSWRRGGCVSSRCATTWATGASAPE
jgi:cation diffusion facilitator CzcD-associated flavoprotein CzcO